MAPTTATVVVIGDEILKGQVQDTNSHYLAGRLHAHGIHLQRMLTVPDHVAAIAEAVVTWSRQSDYVITTGGIGPTHDDVTYEGVAAAFGVSLSYSAELARATKQVVGCEAGKMAMIPSTGCLVQARTGGLPVVRVNNVFILPGVPMFCELGCETALPAMQAHPVQFYTQDVVVKAGEPELLSQINAVVDRFKERVSLGSYPFQAASGSWHTRVSLESTCVDDLCDARAALVDSLPADMVDVSLTEADVRRVYDLAAGTTPFAKAVDSAIQVIEKAIEKFTWSNVVLSFNGGKDCTVLLHLLWVVYSRNKCGSLDTLYVVSEDTFPEIAEFVDACRTCYSLQLHSLPGPIKPAVEQLVMEKPHLKAVWMGTRRSDPFSQKQHFQKCDDGWPPLYRVSPLLDWSYDDVWRYLRCLAVPYCSLYDRGYTSLGHKSNTAPNPALLDPLTNAYLPAYRLQNAESERSGRS